jgi:cytochrome c oxidase assembly factor CtaG
MLQHLSVVKVTLLWTADSLKLVVVIVLSAGPSTGETTLLIQRLNAWVLQLVQLYTGVTKEKHFALCNAQFKKK